MPGTSGKFAVFQAAISQLRPKKEELDKQEDLLSQQIVAGADEGLVTKQVDKVEAYCAGQGGKTPLL